jgi:hypothetical protein
MNSMLEAVIRSDRNLKETIAKMKAASPWPNWTGCDESAAFVKRAWLETMDLDAEPAERAALVQAMAMAQVSNRLGLLAELYEARLMKGAYSIVKQVRD